MAPGNGTTPGSVFLRFLRLGVQAWGGPVAQIGMMHRELVERERWVDETTFRRVLAVYQAIPGPEANELAVYFGYRRGGRLAGLLAGLGFMLPGFLLCLAAAAAYVTFGADRAGVAGLLYAVKPVVIALIANALARLGKNAWTNDFLAHVGIAAGLLAGLAGLNFVLTILGLGTLYFLARRRGSASLAWTPLPLLGISLPALPMLAALFVVFLEVGLLTFGGAYTAIPLIEETVVRHYGWITHTEFLDALALSSLLPAPLVIVGTFVGFVAGGLKGALLATLGIYLPMFAFTLLFHERLTRLVEDPRTHDFFDGVTAPDATTVALGVAAFAALRLLRANVAFVVLVAGLLGVALELVGRVP
ncbi:MAG: chromate efflux transporter [Euryarchaeota archaeon]|nr:chromate efflux transporter [Euryarchaeota archaeon]